MSKSKNSHYSNSVPENIHYSNSVSETVTIQILCHGKVCQRIACQRIATTQIVCHRAGKMKVLTSVSKQTRICTWYLLICSEHLCLYHATWHRTNSMFNLNLSYQNYDDLSCSVPVRFSRVDSNLWRIPPYRK